MKKLLLIFIVTYFVSCSSELTKPDFGHEAQGIVNSNRRNYSEIINIAQSAISTIDDDGTKTRGIPSSRRINVLDGIKCISSANKTRSGVSYIDTLLYIINFEDNMGFAVIAANKNISPIIALVEQGNYEPGTLTGNPGFDDFMSAAMEYVEEESNSHNENARTAQDHYQPTYAMYRPFYDTIISRIVSPRIKVRWGQDVMMIKDTGHKYVGCGPTAIAQIMSAFHFPTTYREYSFTSGLIIGNHDVPWDDMTTGEHIYTMYNHYVDDAYKAMANIAYEIGIRANANYTEDYTTTTNTDLRAATISYGFNCDAIVNHNRTSTSDFGVLTNELCNNKLICMFGYNYTNIQYGHTFVIDGCKYVTCNYSIKGSNDGVHWYRDPDFDNYNITYTSELMHINWGQNGNGNGYFNYSVFDARYAWPYDPADDNCNPSNVNNSEDWDYSRNLNYFTVYLPN